MNPTLPQTSRRRAMLACFFASLLTIVAQAASPLYLNAEANAWGNLTTGGAPTGTLNNTSPLKTESQKATYLRFSVTGVTGKLGAVQLRLHWLSGPDGVGTATVYAANNSGGSAANGVWSETASAANWPYRAAAAIYQGPMPAKNATTNNVLFDITDQYLTGDGVYSFVVVTSSSFTFSSNSDATNRPKLVVAHAEDSTAAVTYESSDLVIQGELHGARCDLAADLGTSPGWKFFKKYGVIDATKQPYGAKSDGTDQRLAIQRAINDARLARAVVYLPTGTYTVSDTIEMVQGVIDDTVGIAVDPTAGRYAAATAAATVPHTPVEVFNEKWTNAREFGNALMGPSTGGRAILKLQAHTVPGNPFDLPAAPKAVLRLWSRSDLGTPTENRSGINYNQTVSNIDIDLNGTGNKHSGAVGMALGLAQGGTIADCQITASNAYGGFYGSTGPGGGIYNTTVTGGQYAVHVVTGGADGSGQQALITACTFTGQTQNAILWVAGAGGLTVVGTNILSFPGTAGAIKVASGTGGPWNGTLCLVDSKIELTKSGGSVGIVSDRGVYLNRVHVKNANPVTVRPDGGDLTSLTRVGGWLKIAEYAGGAFIAQYPYGGSTKSWVPRYENAVRKDDFLNGTLVPPTSQVASAPDYLPAHKMPATPWFLETTNVINVKTDYGAQGDGVSDDTAVIQQALTDANTSGHPNAGKAVFLPKGDYRLSAPLQMYYSSQLFGIHKNLTIIQSMYRDLVPGANAFDDASAPQPLVISATGAGSNCLLAELMLEQRLTEAGSYLLNWKAGANSVVKNVTFMRHPMVGTHADTDAPMILVQGNAGGNGGGRFYSVWGVANSVKDPGNYRHLKVDHTTQALAFYMANFEYAHNLPQTEFATASNVNIYQSKWEGNYRNATFTDCTNFRVFGLGGNASPFPSDVGTYTNAPYANYGADNENILVKNSTFFLFAGQSYQQRAGPYQAELDSSGNGHPSAEDKTANDTVYGTSVGPKTNPTKFVRLREKNGANTVIQSTPGEEQFILYKRDNPTPTIPD